jgi:outer membrane protein TolC
LTTLLLAETALQETRAKLVELQQKVTVATVHLRRAAGGSGVAAELEPTTAPARE